LTDTVDAPIAPSAEAEAEEISLDFGEAEFVVEPADEAELAGGPELEPAQAAAEADEIPLDFGEPQLGEVDADAATPEFTEPVVLDDDDHARADDLVPDFGEAVAVMPVMSAAETAAEGATDDGKADKKKKKKDKKEKARALKLDADGAPRKRSLV